MFAPKSRWVGVLAALVLCVVLSPGTASATNILINPGFETGGLAPWTNSNDFCGGCTWDVTNTDAHTGSFSAFVRGNRLLEQQFAATSTALISEASLWLRIPGTGIAAVFFHYSNGSDFEHIVSVGDEWTQFDLTSFLTPGLDLTQFGVYGCSGCTGPLTFADDFVVDTTATVPEPASMLLLGTGLLGAALRRRRA